MRGLPDRRLLTVLMVLSVAFGVRAAGARKPTPSPRPYAVVEAVIGEEGNVESAKIVKSGGAELDRQALELVKGRKYKPVMKDKKPTKAFLTMSVALHPEP